MKGRGISLIKKEDEGLFKAFRMSGYITEKQIKELDFNVYRVKKFAKDGYLEKLAFLNKDGSAEFVYKLTDKGKSFCSGFFDLNNFHTIRSVLSEIALVDRYIALSEEERNTWMTKGDMVEKSCFDIGAALPDAIYITEGRMVAIQTRTVNSDKGKLQEKRDFCILHDIEYIEIKV